MGSLFCINIGDWISFFSSVIFSNLLFLLTWTLLIDLSIFSSFLFIYKLRNNTCINITKLSLAYIINYSSGSCDQNLWIEDVNLVKTYQIKRMCPLYTDSPSALSFSIFSWPWKLGKNYNLILKLQISYQRKYVY